MTRQGLQESVLMSALPAEIPEPRDLDERIIANALTDR
jgi:hypothetical protein